jgi:hypothetical protein
MKNLILTISIVVSVIFGSFGQSVYVYDFNMGREEVVELPDTIFCIFGNVESNSEYNFVSFDYVYGLGEEHYFIFEPLVKEVFIDESYEKRAVLDDNLYILNRVIPGIESKNIVYLSELGDRISKEEHEKNKRFFQDNLDALAKIFGK